jgi:hypothetical protein
MDEELKEKRKLLYQQPSEEKVEKKLSEPATDLTDEEFNNLSKQ